MRVADRPFPVVELDPVPMLAGWPVRPVIAIDRVASATVWDDPATLWDDPATLWDDTWIDATCAWQGCEIDTGQPDDDGLFPAARAVVHLDNASGDWSRYDADGTSSLFGPGRTLAIWAHNPGGDWWLFYGTIARWDQRADDTIEVEAFDAFADLAQPIGTFTPGAAGDKPGARLASILTAAGRAAFRVRLAVGTVALTRQETDQAPLEEAQTVTASDGGLLYVDADGTIVSTERTWRAGRDDQVTVPAISDNVCAADVVVWDALISTNDDGLADQVILENVAGLRAVAGAPVGYVLTRLEQQWTTQLEGDAVAAAELAGRQPRRLALDEFDLYLLDPNQAELWRAVDWRRADRLRFLHDQRVTGGGVSRVDATVLLSSIVHDITPDGWVMTCATSRATTFTATPGYDTGELYDTGQVYGY